MWTGRDYRIADGAVGPLDVGGASTGCCCAVRGAMLHIMSLNFSTILVCAILSTVCLPVSCLYAFNISYAAISVSSFSEIAGDLQCAGYSLYVSEIWIPFVAESQKSKHL